ncbi:MAG: choice-of-anchor Q domain-containing protein [Myxococcota bacterium]
MSISSPFFPRFHYLPALLTATLGLLPACYQGVPNEDEGIGAGTDGSGPGGGDDDPDGGSADDDSTGGSGNDDNGSDGPPPPLPPELPSVCEGFDAQDVSLPDVTIEGADCNEGAIRAAVEDGGTVLVRCPDAPVAFTSEILITQDTVIDGDGVTVFDGGGATRLLHKIPGPDLHLQNITLQNARGPQALGNPEVTQANWFQWAGGAILAECHDNAVSVGGAVYGKNLTCQDNATGPHTRDPNTQQILDTGTGGCIYSFTCTFHCDECDLSNNRATNGGAIGTLGGKTRLTHSRCAGNEARYDESTNDNQGFGGCYYQDGTETAPGEDDVNYVEMCGNVLAGNRSDENGGAVSLYYRQYTNTRFVFERNACQDNRGANAGLLYGGGGCLYVYVDPDTKIPWAPDEGPDTFIVSSNAFLNNSAEYLGGGAAIYNIWQTEVRFDNNLFVGNETRTTDQSAGGGGALGLVGTYFSVEHSTFVSNTSNSWTGGIHLGAGAVELHNNLFYDNRAPISQGSGTASPTEHINWNLDESDDGQNSGFLVFASSGNLYFPNTTEGGEVRPSPAAVVTGQEPLMGELSDDSFPPHLPLQAGSPAVDAGTARGITVDMRGEPRDGAPDIGAFEQTP